MKIIDKLAWIELKDKTILSTKNFGKDKYYLPVVKERPEKQMSKALIREINEELSVTIDNKT